VKGRLLVLDDDAEVGHTIRAMAESVGFEVRAATQAAEFFLIEADWRPTHVALDLVMPDIDGVEVLRQLARQHSAATIIITSGAGSRVIEAAQRGSLEHGLDVIGSLSKPFAPSELRALLLQDRPNPAIARPRPGSPDPPQGEISEAALQAGLEARQLSVFYQPKISCSDGEIAGFEALVRWKHPERGLIRPDAFIPVAERTGLIRELTVQVMDMALGWLAASDRDRKYLLSVNISAQSLGDMRFADEISSACKDKGVEPDRIILEITETSAMADPLTTLDLLTRLRIKGFQLSIDDFGVGFSSMVQLARLPFSELKVDMSFVKNLARSGESKKIVQGIIGLAHSLGLRVTAEGVEDGDALNYLRSAKCDLAQGYFIGRPMDQTAILNWVAAYRPL